MTDHTRRQERFRSRYGPWAVVTGASSGIGRETASKLAEALHVEQAPVGVDVLADVLRERVRAGVAVLFSSHQLELVERLCDEVTIVDSGRVVASGTIAALRAGQGAHRYRVVLDGGWTTWADSVRGARVVSDERGEVLLELAPGTDDQVVLDAARAAGRVLTFDRVTPSLAELFREVVPR